VTVAFGVTLVALGFSGAFVAGLLGVGGAVVMIPLLLYVPPLLEVGRLGVKAVAGVTMTQVLVAAATGMLAHRRHRAVNAELAWVGGLAMAGGSLAGALASKLADDRALLVVFALMVTGAAFLVLVGAGHDAAVVDPAQVRFSRRRAALVAGGVGVAAGLVGAGGAFLLVPLLLVAVGVPIRVAIGSSLAITAVAASAGFLGKLVTGQIPLLPTLAVVLGAIPGVQLGAALSQRVSPLGLRVSLFVFVVLTALKVWSELLFH
jgi:uncharacterized membrane protein YfcA